MPHNEKGRAPARARTSEHRPACQLDDREGITAHTESASNFASSWLARRFGLPVNRAALVAALAGIGGNLAPVVPAMLGGMR